MIVCSCGECMQDDLMNDCLAGYRDGMKQADDEFIGW